MAQKPHFWQKCRSSSKGVIFPLRPNFSQWAVYYKGRRWRKGWRARIWNVTLWPFELMRNLRLQSSELSLLVFKTLLPLRCVPLVALPIRLRRAARKEPGDVPCPLTLVTRHVLTTRLTTILSWPLPPLLILFVCVSMSPRRAMSVMLSITPTLMARTFVTVAMLSSGLVFITVGMRLARFSSSAQFSINTWLLLAEKSLKHWQCTHFVGVAVLTAH